MKKKGRSERFLNEGGESMGSYLNPGSDLFEMALRSQIFVDKSGLIEKTNRCVRTLQRYICVSRPRRFGKSLNMSMLKYFFEIGNDQSIFEDLEISKDKELCNQYQGKFPVISVSLKGAKAGNYEDAKDMIREVKSYELLLGARGTKPAQIDQIEETLLRLSQLVNDFKFIDELDINPMLISEKTGEGIAVDGRIKVRLKEACEALKV